MRLSFFEAFVADFNPILTNDSSYETSDGTKRDEAGSLNGNGALVVKGSYSYVGKRSYIG